MSTFKRSTTLKIKSHFAATYGARCFYCHQKAQLTIDHLVPKSKGGGNNFGNLRPACSDCNEKKRDLLPGQFRVAMLNRDTPRGIRIGHHQCGNLFCCE